MSDGDGCRERGRNLGEWRGRQAGWDLGQSAHGS